MAVKVKNYNKLGEEKGTIKLSGPLFESEYDESSVYFTVVGHLANKRKNNAWVKDRSEVKGSGRKPWRQKGTGRARHGSRYSPIWVGGGVTFGPRRKEFNYKVNKKVKRKALRTALSSRVKDEKFLVLEKEDFEEPSTKLFANTLKALNLYGEKVLMLFNDNDKNFYLSGRNIENLKMLPVNKVNAYDVLNSDWVVVTEDALETLREVWG